MKGFLASPSEPIPISTDHFLGFINFLIHLGHKFFLQDGVLVPDSNVEFDRYLRQTLFGTNYSKFKQFFTKNYHFRL
jgi:hypothetical protein